jgi:hypothetical protein
VPELLKGDDPVEIVSENPISCPHLCPDVGLEPGSTQTAPFEMADPALASGSESVSPAPGGRGFYRISLATCPLDRVSMASPADPVTNLLSISDGCSEGRTLVVDGGRLVGIISPSDISRLLQRSPSSPSQATVRRA